MAQRVADGKRIWNEPWSHLARDVFFWCLFVGSDSLGLQAETPASIAEALTDEKLKVSVRTVVAAIDELCAGEKPTLLRYTEGRKTFLVFRRWQDHQKIRFRMAPTCPLPPVETLEKLSEKTRQLLCSNYGVTYTAATADSRATVSVSVSVTGTTDTAGSTRAGAAKPRRPPRSRKGKGQGEATCAFCAEPRDVEDEALAPVHRLLQDYHGAYRAEHEKCPTLSTRDCAAAGAAFKRLLKAGHSIPHIRAVVRHGLQSEDNLMVNSGWSILQIGRQFDGIARALEREEVHGTHGRRGRRAPPAPQEEHGAGGAVDL